MNKKNVSRIAIACFFILGFLVFSDKAEATASIYIPGSPTIALPADVDSIDPCVKDPFSCFGNRSSGGGGTGTNPSNSQTNLSNKCLDAIQSGINKTLETWNEAYGSRTVVKACPMIASGDVMYGVIQACNGSAIVNADNKIRQAAGLDKYTLTTGQPYYQLVCVKSNTQCSLDKCALIEKIQGGEPETTRIISAYSCVFPDEIFLTRTGEITKLYGADQECESLSGIEPWTNNSGQSQPIPTTFKIPNRRALTQINNNLGYGLRNNSEVSSLQTTLKNSGFFSGDITGNFFGQTQQAVQAFQRAKGIDPTGFVGPITRLVIASMQMPSQGDEDIIPPVGDLGIKPPNSNTPIPPKFATGDSVKTTQGPLNVRVSPYGTSVGSQLLGSYGKIVSGPARASRDNTNWWNVDYQTGVDGWSIEAALEKASVPNSDLPTTTVDLKYNNSDGPLNLIAGNTAPITLITLSWSGTNINSCVMIKNGVLYNDGIYRSAGGVNTNYSGIFYIGAQNANTTWRIQCEGSSGKVSDDFIVNVSEPTSAPTPTTGTPIPTVSFNYNNSTNPVSVTSGGSVNFSWSATNINKCQMFKNGSLYNDGVYNTFGVNAPSYNNTFYVGNITSSATYTLTCTGAGGSQSASMAVNVSGQSSAPTVSLSINSSFGSGSNIATAGSYKMLDWSSTNTTSCTASGGWSGTKATSGSLSVGPISQTTPYTITCTGAGGTQSASITINVSATPPTGTCNISIAQTLSCPTGQTGSINQTRTVGAYPSCIAGAWTTTANTCVTTPTPVPGVSLSINPSYNFGSSTVSPGTSSVLDWSATNATSCSAPWLSYTNSLSGSQTVGPVYQTTTYTLTCTGSGGTNSASLTINVLAPTQTVPTAPTGLTATAGACGTGVINLSWAPVSNVINYSIYGGNNAYYGGMPLQASITGTSYVDNGATSASAGFTPGNTYSYYVIARNSVGDSSPSNTVSAVAPGSCSSSNTDTDYMVPTSGESGDIPMTYKGQPNLASVQIGFDALLKVFQEYINGLNR